MALLGSLNKPLMSTRGPLGKIIDMAVKGMGGGVLANVVDQELLQKKLTGMGVPLPWLSALGPTPVSANLTDVAMFAAVNGVKIPSKGSLMVMGGLFFMKKLAEARGWIVDDPIRSYTWKDGQADPQAPAMQSAYVPTVKGGLTHS